MVRTLLGVAFFRVSAPDSGAAEAQFKEIATLAASIVAAASAGAYFFIWCSPVATPPKLNDRSAPASLKLPSRLRAILVTLWRNLMALMTVASCMPPSCQRQLHTVKTIAVSYFGVIP